jgi:hypothetical protein
MSRFYRVLTMVYNISSNSLESGRWTKSENLLILFIVYGLPASLWFLAWLILQRWRWRQNFPSKHQLTFNWLYCVTSQKIEGLLVSSHSRLPPPRPTNALDVTLCGYCFPADRISDSTNSARLDWGRMGCKEFASGLSLT